MLNDERITRTRTNNILQEVDHIYNGHEESPIMRDIHALTPPSSSHRSAASSSSTDGGGGEGFTTISREFNALVLAGSRIRTENQPGPSNLLGRIGEDLNMHVETNPLAIVLDTNPLQSPPHDGGAGGGGEAAIQRVRKEEAESRISAWQTAKIAKINNRFKREEAVIHGWEDKHVHKSCSWMKQVERKLEEKRARCVEKMQNEIAKSHRKAEEKRASAEAKRGTKVARVLEIANLMRAMGRPPTKRSFFCKSLDI